MQERDLQATLAADRAHLIHPLHHPSAHQAPRVWVRGQGSLITTLEGHEYLDALAGLWNVNIGHGRKELALAAADQIETLAYMSNYVGAANVPAIELAERLSALTYPSINKFFFTSGGGESTDSAIKTARFYWKTQGKSGKYKVISREHAYHGVTLAAMSATGLSQYWPMFEPRVEGFSHIASPYPYYFDHQHAQHPAASTKTPGQAAADLLEEEILRQGADSVAAFIAEPIQGAGGVIVPQDDYFLRIREICDRHDVLLISDEVITGFGRTGTWFALPRWGIEPDILNFAKGITSGYLPLGGIGVSDAIADAIQNVDAAQTYMHSYTYSGHPTCCRVALANLDYMERHDVVARSEDTGRYLQSELQTFASHPQVGDVRGLGMMAAIELMADKHARQRFPKAEKIGPRFLQEMIQRRIWSRVNGDVFVMAPPLTTSREEIDRLVNAIGESLQALFN